ncbi:MAG: hypothetical protein ABSF34_07255 [Verrucomicrobiota bacterium]|jgi:hypothetical protein
MSCHIAAIGQITISCAVAYVAWQQWKTARDKLQLDRYEKRFRIYNATTDFISAVAWNVSGNIGQEQVVKFDIARSEAYFLFAGDNDLLKFLDDLRQKAGDLATWKEQAKGQEVGSEASKEREKLNNWFHDQFDAAKHRFAPYLSFR